MIDKHFGLKNSSVENLHLLGFKKLTFSNDECKYFKYRFPVHKHNSHTVLECELVVNNKTREVFFDIYDNNKEIYVPYYNREYGNYSEFIAKINKEILAEFKKLGIEEAK